MANKENIRKWVDALRSGDYKQGRGQLLDKGKYCCLGVACDISPDEDWAPPSPTLTFYAQKWLGLDASNPQVGGYPLTTQNDVNRLSFSEIADLIEAEWLSDEPA